MRTQNVLTLFLTPDPTAAQSLVMNASGSQLKPVSLGSQETRWRGYLFFHTFLRPVDKTSLNWPFARSAETDTRAWGGRGSSPHFDLVSVVPSVLQTDNGKGQIYNALSSRSWRRQRGEKKELQILNLGTAFLPPEGFPWLAAILSPYLSVYDMLSESKSRCIFQDVMHIKHAPYYGQYLA